LLSGQRFEAQIASSDLLQRFIPTLGHARSRLAARHPSQHDRGEDEAGDRPGA
jgi:hypothetical protein